MKILFEKVARIFPMLISLAALGVSFAAFHVSSSQRDIANSHVIAIRNHQRLSLKPLVRIVPYLEGKGFRNGIYITNVGLGPAIIKSLQIIDGMTTYQLTETKPLIQLLTNMHLNSWCFLKGHPLPDSIIRPGEEFPIVAMTRAETPDCDIPVMSLITRNTLRFKVTYESFYEEPFIFEGSAVSTDPELSQLIEVQTIK